MVGMISIITPSFNSGKFIERTILSVRDQGYPEYEHIIVDAGSADQTASIAKRYKKVRFIVARNTNQSQALNIGFGEASGGVVGWINADDVYEPNAFKAASDYLAKNPSIDLVYSDCRFIDEHGGDAGYWRTSDFSYFRNLNYAQMIPQPTIFFRKTVFERVGYIDESYNYAMDFDFLVRVSKKCAIARLPGPPLASFRLQSSSKTVSQRSRFEPEVTRIRAKHGAVLPYWLVKAVQGAVGKVKRRPG